MLRRKAIKKCASNSWRTCAACTTRIECTPTEIDLELARHACTPWAPWPSIFAPHDVRSQSWGSRAIDVINRQGKYAPSAALCARYICSTPVSFRMESRTPMCHNLILRRASEEGPPEALKTDEQKFRSLRAPDIYWSKPPYSIAARFGADRAEIRPIGTTIWRALPSSPNPSGQRALRMVCDTPY